MKCKSARTKRKEREKVRQAFLKQLVELNPKRYFSQEGVTIRVNMLDLWKLNLPEDCVVLSGKTKKDFKEGGLGYLIVEYEEMRFYIYGW